MQLIQVRLAVYMIRMCIMSHVKMLSQIEEEAIQALEKLYDAMDNADENITVERLQQEHGVPLWVTEHKIF